MNRKVIIIGAGASGLACAVRLKQNNSSTEVCILERLDTPGKRYLQQATDAAISPTKMLNTAPR